MATIQATIVIDRPIEEVFAFVADYSARAQWQSGIIESKIISDGPLAVGSQYKYVAQVLGKRLDTAGEITEHQPPSRHGWKATSGPFPLEGVFTFEEVDGGTRVTSTVEAEGDGFFKLAEPLVIRMVRRDFQTGFDNLKDLLEGAT